MSLQCWMKVATALVIAKPGQSMQKHDWPVWVTACPLKDDSCKSFAGLGSGNTKTEGVRSIPFSLLLPDGNMNGELDSYQLSTGNSPLLLSLHAQTKLGLVKDLAKGVVSIQRSTIEYQEMFKIRFTCDELD